MRQPNRNDYSKWKAALKQKGQIVNITAEEWIEWWENTNQYHLRGNSKDNVNMMRIERKGEWNLSNIKLAKTRDSHNPHY